MITRLAALIGLPSAAMLGWVLLALVGAAAAGGVATGLAVHRYDQAQHDNAVADLRAEAAITLAEANARTLAAERRGAARLAQQEDAYVQLSQARDALAAESARLSADLHAAAERLRRAGADRRGGDGRLPPADGDAERCEDLRAARDRALGALELLQAAGDRIADDGQRAVDVATTCAQAAREAEVAK